MRGEDPRSFTDTKLSVVPGETTRGLPNREPTDIDLDELGSGDVLVSPHAPFNKQDALSTVPSSADSSVVSELRSMSRRSPISRGASPHLDAIAHDIQREKDIIDPSVVHPATPIRDELFAARIMEDRQEAAHAARIIEHERQEEATHRGYKKAEEVGEHYELKSLRTFESDVAEAMRGQKTSMVQIVLAEHQAKESKNETVTKEKKRTSAFLLGSVVFMLLSITVIGVGTWGLFIHRGALPVLETAGAPLIQVESTYEIKSDDSTTEALRSTLAREIATATLSPDEIEYIYVTELIVPKEEKENPYRAIISTERFFSIMGNIAPEWMTRSLGDEYMLGVHAWNGNQVFFLLTVPNFDIAFSNMLSWEKDIPDEILPLIGWRGDESVYSREWEDLLIRNRDMRVLRDGSGNIVLAYTFFDSETLILGTNVDTIDEVVTRVIQKRRTQ
jgi:hypothetical protein